MVDTHEMFAHSAQLIAAVAANPVPVASGIGQWFDYCDKIAPEHRSLWDRLRNLDFRGDAENLTDWLQEVLTYEPPPQNINGLWFGLYNPKLADGKTSCQMYISGSSAFDANSNSNEWVCELSWRPLGRYSSSQVLTELYRAIDPITKDNVSYLGECFLCHGYLALLVSDWCNGPMRASLLGDAAVRAVVMGHDSGDFYRMAVLQANALDEVNPCN